ncbi:MAG: hypothetical protein K1060chlam4_00706 [Candidatus Anoxychlamydiales bacterium]|nr:hypothetical protein [Candidatus Anoxychlamydiales bacterium]
MVTSIMSKPFNAFASAIDKATEVEDKIKKFAKKTFDSIKTIKVADMKNIPSKIFNYVKENKFNLVLATLSIAISAVVFVNVSATAAILFLGAVSFVKVITYTRSYVKSDDYQFKKLSKAYLHSIEDICKNYKNGKQIGSDLKTGYIKTNFYNKQLSLISFIRNNAKNYDQSKNWEKYLEDLNPNLRLVLKSFPNLSGWEAIREKAFGKTLGITFQAYLTELFNYIILQEKKWFKDELKSLAEDLKPQSPTLETDILNKSETLKSFLLDATKKEIALEVSSEIKTPDTPQPKDTDRSMKSSYNIFEFMKRLSPFSNN